MRGTNGISAERLARRGGWIVLVAYALIARGVVNFYPFSVFGMYAGQDSRAISRMGARGPDGVMHDVRFFERWHCPALAPPDVRAVHGFGYIDRESRDFVAAQSVQVPALGAVPVDLVNREWRFADGRATPESRDVVISHCLAVPSGRSTSPVAIDAFHPPAPRGPSR